MWQLYAAYVVLFVIYIDIVGNVAAQYGTTEIIDEYNVIGIVDHPIRTLMHGLMLQAKPLNLDVLQLFVALMAMFPPMLWAMLRRPNLDARRLDRALRRLARLRLEPAGVSDRHLVFQSVLLAAAVRARRLVRGRAAAKLTSHCSGFRCCAPRPQSISCSRWW